MRRDKALRNPELLRFDVVTTRACRNVICGAVPRIMFRQAQHDIEEENNYKK
jgi:hypothetical protein